MISFSKLGKHGRFGNQLWQIASTIGIATSNNTPYTFPKWDYSRYFKHPLPCNTISFNHVIKERYFCFESIKVPPSGNTDIIGWFQSEKYFHHIRDRIKYQFEFSDELNTAIINISKPLPTNACAIHVRRTDYLNIPSFNILTMDYFHEAISMMSSSQFIIFSDDISWCRKAFGNKYAYCEMGSPIEQFAVMSKCDNFIIANSSFSWWAAWLGEKQNTRIITPNPWFDNLDCKDIVPSRWDRLSFRKSVAPIVPNDHAII